MNAADKVIYRNVLICIGLACALSAVAYILLLRDLPFYSFNGVAVAPESADFVGHWMGENLELVVLKHGRIHFRHKQGNSEVTLDLPLQSISPQNISIGMAFWKTDIEIEVPPHAENGTWHMTAEHVDLTRKD
jgi:hypothetical protein